MSKKKLKFLILSTCCISNGGIEILINKSFSDFPQNLIEVDTVESCDEALVKDKLGMYDAYLFDADNCNFFSAMLDATKDYHSKRILFENLNHDNSCISRVNHGAGNQFYFSIDISSIRSNPPEVESALHDKVCKVIRFIVFPPHFYFSYGNKKEDTPELENSRKILLNVEEYIQYVFPNIYPKKDFSDFKKGWSHNVYKNELVNSPFILMILSNDFFISEWCMDEFYSVLCDVNFDLDEFNKKVILIYAGDIDKKIDPKSNSHQAFINNLEDFWIGKFQDYSSQFTRRKNNTNKEHAVLCMNVLTQCFDFIENKLHQILQGERNLHRSEVLKSGHYSDLILEINEKLEQRSYDTFFTGLSNKDEKILRETDKVRTKKLEEAP